MGERQHIPVFINTEYLSNVIKRMHSFEYLFGTYQLMTLEKYIYIHKTINGNTNVCLEIVRCLNN